MADHMADKDVRAKVPKAKIDSAPPAGEGFRNFREGVDRKNAAPSADAAQREPADASPGHARDSVRSWLHATFPGHENAVIWGFVGFLVALLLFIIGFWRTVVVVLLVVVGVAFGQVLDGDPKIINTVRGLFGGDDAR